MTLEYALCALAVIAALAIGLGLWQWMLFQRRLRAQAALTERAIEEAMCSTALCLDILAHYATKETAL